MQRFKALLASKTDAGMNIAWQELGEADLMDGDVSVRVSHSTINYKDGLAITGKAPVMRRWPMIPGIDFAGVVVSSSNAEFRNGDAVILNGWGVGETHSCRSPPRSQPPRPWRSARRAIRPCCACWRWSGTA